MQNQKREMSAATWRFLFLQLGKWHSFEKARGHESIALWRVMVITFVFCCTVWLTYVLGLFVSFFFFLIFIYLAALGLSCGTQDLHCGTRDLLLWGSLQLWHMGSRMDRLSSCPTVFGTLVLPREIKAGSHALETRGHSHWTTLCFLSLFHTLKILLFLGPCHIFLCVTSTPDKIGKCLKLE